jgi:head-tail adaptor
VTTPAGTLRHRLVLQAPVEAADLAGGVTRTWTTLATLWGAIEPLGPTPALVGDAPSSLAVHRVTIRWRADVAAGQRLVKGSRVFVILSAMDPAERRRALVLAVEETTA